MPKIFKEIKKYGNISSKSQSLGVPDERLRLYSFVLFDHTHTESKDITKYSISQKHNKNS